MRPNEAIKKRRLELGLTEVEVAQKADISVAGYGDVETHDDELFSILSLREVKKICEVLDLSLSSLLASNHRESIGGFDIKDIEVPRDQLLRKYRVAQGISVSELADRIGYSEETISTIENSPDGIEGLCIDDILLIARVLKLPPQLLLSSGS